MSRADALRAELAVAELEDQFVAAKERGEVTPQLKAALRQARQEFREIRAGEPPAEGVARPGRLATRAAVNGGGA